MFREIPQQNENVIIIDHPIVIMTGRNHGRMKGSVMAAGLVLVAIVAVTFVGIGVTIMYSGDSLSYQDSVKKFTSCEEMEAFLEKNSGGYGYATLGAAAAPMAGVRQELTMADGAKTNGVSGGGEYSNDYSTTNIQIEGVDEADFVKSDGKYLYVVSGSTVFIVDAYPAEGAEIVSEFNVTGNPTQLFINDNRLVLFTTGGYYWKSGETGSGVMIYDVTDRANPVLSRNITLEGYYDDSRMIGDYVYVISRKGVRDWTEPGIPRIATATAEAGSGSAGSTADVAEKAVCNCGDVYYFDVPDSSYQFTTITSVNVKDDAMEPESKVFLMGYSQNLFVSLNNIYITYKKNIDYLNMIERAMNEVIIPILPPQVASEVREIIGTGEIDYEKSQEVQELLMDYMGSLGPEQGAVFMQNMQDKMEDFYLRISKETDQSVVHRVRINNGNIAYEAGGTFPGQTLNQFSMDEDNGYFRVATTTGGWVGGTRIDTLNNVYVLDMNLNVVGKLEDLAKGERIFSARFIGDRMYMVTFERIDPLFVVDLSVPTAPKVLGELKITGYSDYLHPYDNNHIIGLGMEADEDGRTTGLKISLFDVTDVSNPKELSKYVLEDQSSYSYALYDHKAFLFDKDKELLSIPVRTYDHTKDYPYNQWHGAYVFQVNLQDGIKLRGTIQHDVEYENETDTEMGELWYDQYQYEIRRSLYMDDVLYTLSNRMLKMNSLVNLEEINSLDLPYYYKYYPVYMGGGIVGGDFGIIEIVATPPTPPGF